MPKILSVTSDECYPDELTVELDNGHTLWLNLAPKLTEPLFAEIKELAQPKTDGDRVYWHNGASLTVEEIFSLVNNDAAEVKTQSRDDERE